mmetsp:Transcript_65875/g.157477  ORF Transcript_65875/g.157477 Transcript_65875/m.157477 type:complete len:307 (+) Transcript_65875:240-1160(+)
MLAKWCTQIPATSQDTTHGCCSMATSPATNAWACLEILMCLRPLKGLIWLRTHGTNGTNLRLTQATRRSWPPCKPWARTILSSPRTWMAASSGLVSMRSASTPLKATGLSCSVNEPALATATGRRLHNWRSWRLWPRTSRRVHCRSVPSVAVVHSAVCVVAPGSRTLHMTRLRIVSSSGCRLSRRRQSLPRAVEAGASSLLSWRWVQASTLQSSPGYRWSRSAERLPRLSSSASTLRTARFPKTSRDEARLWACPAAGALSWHVPSSSLLSETWRLLQLLLHLLRRRGAAGRPEVSRSIGRLSCAP